jgi:hypothetical protein
MPHVATAALLVLLTGGVMFAPRAEAAHLITCPATAPAALPHPGTPLEGAEVLSYAPDEPVDPASPPSLVPDEHGRWDFADAKGEIQELWCEYKDNPRAALRLGPGHLKSCAYSGSDETYKAGQPLTAYCD